MINNTISLLALIYSLNIYASNLAKEPDLLVNSSFPKPRRTLMNHNQNQSTGAQEPNLRPQGPSSQKSFPVPSNFGPVQLKPCSLLVSRHNQDNDAQVSLNETRGEGLPYRYTKSLEGLAQDYQEGLWDGQQLNLSGGAYTGSALVPLLSFARDLIYLDLSNNPLNSNDIKLIASSFFNLRILYLNFNKLKDIDGQALSRSTTLTTLGLESSQIGDIGAQALTALTNLTDLNIGDSKLGAAGAQSLAILTNLTHLLIGDNTLGDAGAQSVATLTKLTYLNITENALRDAGARSLAALTNLTGLSIEHNNIGDAGAQALATLIKLTYLDVEKNEIGDVGAQSLAALTNLTDLNIGSNCFSDTGAHALAALTQLKHLDVGENNISDAAETELEERLNQTELFFLCTNVYLNY